MVVNLPVSNSKARCRAMSQTSNVDADKEKCQEIFDYSDVITVDNEYCSSFND